MQDKLSTAALERSVALDAVVRLWDFPSRALAVHVANGSARVEAIEPADIARRNPQFVFETWSDLLRRTIRSPFGRDLISVGYGAEVHIRSRQDLDGADNEPLLSLLAPPQPRWRERLRKDPLRTLGFIVGDPSMRFELASHVPGIRRGAAQTEPGLYQMRDWFAGPNTSPTREVARHV
jgi:hypothetical protein